MSWMCYNIFASIQDVSLIPTALDASFFYFWWYNLGTMASCDPQIFGADPANITWQVVRGDTAELRVEFYENDEATAYDTTGWTYEASAYDYKAEVTDELEVTAADGYVTIVAPADLTQQWATGYGSKLAELAFDLQVTVDADTVWTPVIGTIVVLGDVTGGSL